jgi:integrase
MRGIHRLSHKRLATAKDGWHHDGAGLYFRRKGDGASWVFRLFSRHDRSMHMLGIGAYPQVGLDAARETAAEYRRRLVRGEDVVALHAQRRHDITIAPAANVTMAYTFERAARECIAAKEPGWKGADNSKQWTETLQNYAFPLIGRVDVSRIDTPHVMKVLKPIWTKINPTATRVRQRIEAVLDWAGAHGYRDGERKNPARWEGHLEHLLPNGVHVVKHQPAVQVKQMPEFMALVRAVPTTTMRALEMLALTATRTTEGVRKATFGEFDLEERLWVIPPERHKTGKKSGRPLIVPLSARACAIVKEQFAKVEDKSPNGLVFPGARGGLMGGHQMSDHMHGINGGRFKDADAGKDAVPHGLRSTFRNWCALNGKDDSLSEMAMAHQVGSAVKRAYLRDPLVEQRRAIMDAWSEYCGG